MTKKKATEAQPNAAPAEQTEQIDCFTIMPISTQPDYEDGHFQFVYEDIIRRAVESAGMKPFRADETQNTNLIQLDILRSVIESPIAICDMSAKNPNVFYELGLRQAFDLPTVLIIDDRTAAPFDISSLRFVTYDSAMGYRGVESAVKQLSEALIDTYEKRNDKSEINSLIRLLELTKPASISEADLPENERVQKSIEQQLLNLSNQIERLGKGRDPGFSSKETIASHPITTPSKIKDSSYWQQKSSKQMLFDAVRDLGIIITSDDED